MGGGRAVVIGNLYVIAVGGDRKNWRNRIEVKAGSYREAKEKAWRWLGDAGRETRLSARLSIGETRFHDELPPSNHPLYRSVARREAAV